MTDNTQQAHDPAAVGARLAEIRERAEKATEGPWLAETNTDQIEEVYWTVRTQDALPEHPWSPRFIVWIMGVVSRRLPDGPRTKLCPECHQMVYRRRKVEIPVDFRQDDNMGADAQFIAHARQDVPYLLRLVERLQEENGRSRSQVSYLRHRLREFVPVDTIMAEMAQAIGGNVAPSPSSSEEEE